MTSGTLGEVNMGDEVISGVSNVYYAAMNEDGTYGELHEIGDAVSLSLSDLDMDDDEMDKWADTLVDLQNQTHTIHLKLPWFWQNTTAYKSMFGNTFGYRRGGIFYPEYTIPRLRRGGKSHKGKGRKK